MLRKFWLLFAQACTLCVAALFVVATLRPDLLPRLAGKAGNVIVTQETTTPPWPAAAGGDVLPTPRRRRCRPSSTSTRARQCARAIRCSTIRCCAAIFPDFAHREPSQRATSLGSGVIVSPEGYVITNHHVIEGADDIQLVLTDGRQLRAQVRGTDPGIGSRRAQGRRRQPAGDHVRHAEDLQVGDVVLAIGNPFGFGNTVTLGIVSALGRNYLGVNRFEDFIQTDAAINPGNSGGALIDTGGQPDRHQQHDLFADGRVERASASRFPSRWRARVFEQIIRDGEVTRGWLGIEPQPITPDWRRRWR